MSVTHSTHRCLDEQMGVAVPAQSPLVTHWTQRAVTALQCGATCGHCESPEQPGVHSAAIRSQCGLAAGHCASPVQPARHANKSGSHTGADVPQSAFDTHWTHEPLDALQRG